MIKLFYVTITILLLFFGATFAYMNTDEMYLVYFSAAVWVHISVLLVLTLLAGIVLGFILSLPLIFKARRRRARPRKLAYQPER